MTVKQSATPRAPAVEPLEARHLLAKTIVSIDFQPAGVATQAGMLADTGQTYAARNGFTYGWDKPNTAAARDRNSPLSAGQSYDTFNTLRDATGANRTWQIAMPSGTYSLRVVSGDALAVMSPVIRAEGVAVVSGTTTTAHHWIDATKTVVVTDGKLTLTNGSTTSKSAICFIQIKSTATTVTPPPAVPVNDGGAWPKTSAWHAAQASPINRFESHAFSYGGRLYVMGGWADGDFNSTKRVDVYNPATNTWSTRANMQAPETHAGAALDEAHGIIYFVGGHRGKYPSVASREVWTYTIATDTWTKLAVALPYAMGANSCQIVGGKLYSFGGNYADRTTNTSDMFVLDLADTAAGFKQLNDFPSARDHLSSVVIGGFIYAFGGEFGHDLRHSQQKILQRYDPDSDTWTRLADMPGPKSHAECSTLVVDGKIVIAGGQTTPQSPSSSAYSYDPATGAWSTIAGLPAMRQGTVVQRVGNYYVFTTGGIATDQPQRDTWVVKVA